MLGEYSSIFQHSRHRQNPIGQATAAIASRVGPQADLISAPSPRR